MVQKEKFYLTKEGLKKIEKEYKRLRKIRGVKSKRDVPSVLHSDELNAEFVSYKEDIEFLEARLQELEHILKNFELIKPPPRKKRDEVHLGAKLKIELDGEIDEFVIVGTLEADPSQQKISNESPIGKALLNHKVGDTVVAKAEMVNHICKILEIKY
ncbi:MAG: GreA/GreB family elongation factor [Patescibacteria group bacterium]|nr:GreA/GreB family elongation factor [Patescibacteria group bacterium]